jgi:capsular exopolysaccharide synthesis family protein
VAQKKNTSIISDGDLKSIWRIVIKNWYIPLLITPIFFLIGYFYIYKLTNVYQASVELLKKNDSYYKGNLISDQGGGFYGSSKTYIDNSNEMRILRSHDLMKTVVYKLKDRLEVSYYIVGRVRTTEQFIGMPFMVRVNSVNSNMHETSIKFKILDYNQFELIYIKDDVEIIKKGFFDKELVDVDFNLLITRESNFTKNTADITARLEYEIIIHNLDALTQQYRQNLLVENPDFTNALVLKFEDIIPARAVILLDTLSKVYIEKSLETRFILNERTIEYIDKQLQEVSLSLNEIEDTMQLYKRRNNILDLDWEREDFFKKMSFYDGQKTSLNLRIEAMNDLEKYIIEDKDPTFLPPNAYIISDDNFLVKSVDELYNGQIAINEQLNFAKEINPKIIDEREKIKKLKQNILVYLSNARRATHKSIENIDIELSKFLSQIKDIPSHQQDLLNIQRKVSVNETLYNFLLQSKANTKIGKAAIVPEIQVIDSPRNMGVIKPDKNKIQSIFLIVGLGISLVIVLIRVLFFTTIQTVEELKEKTHLPIIGDLPFQKGVLNTGFVVEDSPSSYIAEAFRALRTNLQYVILNSDKKTILVTSNSPGEGKTFTTINLAAIIAKSGKKVVMLELDLHKPRIQKALEMNADIGISTFMLGSNTLDEIVKPTNIANLYTILSGPIPPNPSDLVLSEKLKELMNYVKDKFDYILIDTPPVGMLADAAYLMQYSDINLMVLNTKFATKKVLELFHKLTQDNDIKSVYLILNGVKRQRSRYYYSRYGYGYGYGYGYSNKKS